MQVPYKMDDKDKKEDNLELLNIALNSIKVLRSSVGLVFDSTSNGVRAEHGEDGKEKFLQELQGLVATASESLR